MGVIVARSGVCEYRKSKSLSHELLTLSVAEKRPEKSIFGNETGEVHRWGRGKVWLATYHSSVSKSSSGGENVGEVFFVMLQDTEEW